MAMPRYPIQSLRVYSNELSSISSVVVKTEDGQSIDVGSGLTAQHGADFPMQEVDRQLKRYFHPDRFLFQIAFAVVTTFLLVFVLFLLPGLKVPVTCSLLSIDISSG